MFELEMNRKYLVKDSSHTLEYKVWFEQSKAFDDLVIVHDELYHDTYYMTIDEVKEEFEFIK